MSALWMLLAAVLVVQGSPHLHAQRTAVATRAQLAAAADGAVDGGTLPVSTPVEVTFWLAPNATQETELEGVLTAQMDAGSATYHQWLTPAEYASSFGPSDAEMEPFQSWLQGAGLTVSRVSPSRMRVMVTGTAGQIEQALQVSLRRVVVGSAEHFANSSEPSVPAQFAGRIVAISGLDDLTSPGMARVVVGLPGARGSAGQRAQNGAVGTAERVGGGTVESSAEALDQLADAVDANTQVVLTMSSTACADGFAPEEIASFRAVLRQAQAQGITVLSAGACEAADGSSVRSVPGSLAETTSATMATMAVADQQNNGLETRPAWQAARGLPADGLRHAPDVETSSLEAFAQTVVQLNQEVRGRVGNLNSTLYALAKTPGLFTQLGEATTQESGTWTAEAGLGVISLPKLLQAYPRGVNSTQVSLVSSTYALGYGDTFTLTARVLPNSYAAANPTGTVTFSSSTQGVLGSVSIDGNGNATLTPDVLPVGVYSVTATYSGDANYTGATSTSKVTITISIVNARLLATISPQTNVPYGATATVTATVNLPGAGAAPSGPVSAQIEGVTGANFSATLSPNPGGTSATANIVLSMPPPGNYTVQVTCQGNTNYQCQTPVNLPVTAVKGYTNTTVAVTPAAPQAGQPISLTATVANAGNGTATYTYNGSVSFYDSGKLLATAPVATNQATTTLSLSGNRTHNIIAIYTGDSNWNTSTSGAVAVTPTILPDELTISSNVSGSSSLAGVNLIFTGTTTTNITYGIGPTGTISFFDTFNGAVVQLGNPAALVANGPTASIALFTTTGLLPGTHRIYAQYSGDGNYASAISPVMQLTLSDFNVSMTPTSLTLAQGKSQQVSVFVGNSGGFAGTVSLGCTPPSSSQATCSFSPSAVTGGGLSTLTITTLAASSSVRTGAGVHAGLWTAGTGATLAALLLIVIPGGSRRRLPTLLAVMLAAGVSANLGCGLGVTAAGTAGGSDTGSGSSAGSGSSVSDGTPLGTQNFVITAAGSDGVNTIRHSYQYQVTVQ